MQKHGRREFLSGSLAVAAWTAVAGAPVEARDSPEPGADPTGRPKPPTRRFLDAVVAGDLDAARDALTQDPGLIHARDEAGRSAFALALLHRHTDLAAMLRERGHAPDLHESALVLDWERFGQLASKTPSLATAFGDPTPIADRILEELATQVGERASVVGPTTTASYAHADASLRQLAADHELDYIVNGRFIDGQDGPRMLAKLIRTADGAHVWVEAYRDLRDDRRIGLEIARAVRTELGLTD